MKGYGLYIYHKYQVNNNNILTMKHTVKCFNFVATLFCEYQMFQNIHLFLVKTSVLSSIFGGICDASQQKVHVGQAYVWDIGQNSL